MSVTPGPSKQTDKKRCLSSPVDLAEVKKYRSVDPPTSTTTTIVVCTTMAESGHHIQLGNADLVKISELLRSSFESQLSTMTATIVEGVLGGLQTKIAELETENKSLRTRVQTLEDQIDKTDQYSRRNCIRLSGVAEIQGESVDDKVMDIIESIGADVPLDYVDRAHRLGKPMPNVPRDIIVKFATYRSKKRVMLKKSNLKKNGRTGVYINDDLTRVRSDIYYKARSLFKDKKISSTWSADGTIIIKDNEMKFHRIETQRDMDNFAQHLTTA